MAGVDHWRPAVESFNFNFGVQWKPTDILQYENNPKLIETLPDTDIIIGSPPCVSFSYSNKLGNADKTEGLRLIKVFLSIVAVKKFKVGTRLLAWYMENVSNALKSLPPSYTFANLGLSTWAKERGLHPNSTAIRVRQNATILNSADFGVAQNRKRLFLWEFNLDCARRRRFEVGGIAPLSKGSKVIPASSIRLLLPPPNSVKSKRTILDPNDKKVRLPLAHITDHFYETGAYEIHWRESKHLKISHPYMGRMAFPEDERKPSRTIVASPFPRSREALLYKSEWGRKGDGEYRGPTVREAATLMSFPITYQFIGSEGAKWQLVGNAVCPRVARSLAIQLLKTLHVPLRCKRRKNLPRAIESISNLNTFSSKVYDSPPKRKPSARFRSHPLKAGNMTVALANYDLTKRGANVDGSWRCFVTYGISQGYRVQSIKLSQLERIKIAVERHTSNGRAFVDRVTNGFSEKIPSAKVLQQLYEANEFSRGTTLNPQALLEETKQLIYQFTDHDTCAALSPGLFLRDTVPVSQLYALFAVCHIITIARRKADAPDE
jgi:DNA (cytosine-5)-methyltransferase 1